MKIYLAGPDVFLPDAVAMGQRKREICARHGLVGLFPLDNDPGQGDAPLSRRIFDANTALRAGFVNELVPPGEELALAQQWAEQLASLAPNSVQMTKRLLREAQQAGLSAVIAREGEALVAALSSGEVREALTAFLEKRRPDFSLFH